ncbi:MAG: hypothetical protein MK538_10875, partial [Planctomycetes bacterium]|nr:hypothetical protein [Planctomycetota bacterium]
MTRPNSPKARRRTPAGSDRTSASHRFFATRSRRSVLRGGAAFAAAALAPTIVPRHVLGGPGFTPPSERLHVAVVGTGGRGKRL